MTICSPSLGHRCSLGLALTWGSASDCHQSSLAGNAQGPFRHGWEKANGIIQIICSGKLLHGKTFKNRLCQSQINQSKVHRRNHFHISQPTLSMGKLSFPWHLSMKWNNEMKYCTNMRTNVRSPNYGFTMTNDIKQFSTRGNMSDSSPDSGTYVNSSLMTYLSPLPVRMLTTGSSPVLPSWPISAMSWLKTFLLATAKFSDFPWSRKLLATFITLKYTKVGPTD